MEIELNDSGAIVALLIILISVLLFFGLVGRFVTPVFADEPQVLTPSRWTAYKLQKQAYRETRRLIQDAERLNDLLNSETPDPVEAMLVAQDLYATWQSGSSATAAARNALIAAAQATVQAAVGEIPRDEAVAAYNSAIDRIKALSFTDQQESQSSSTTIFSSLTYLQR